MCRHLLPLLAGGSFPVAQYSAAARNDKRQVLRCFPLSLAFGSCPIDRRSPCQSRVGRNWQTHRRRPGTASPDGAGDSHWDNPQAGRWAIADSVRRLTAATRSFTGKDQQHCSIGK
jgi:hypothetical protein